MESTVADWENRSEYWEVDWDTLYSTTQPFKYEFFHILGNEEVPNISLWSNEIMDRSFVIVNHMKTANAIVDGHLCNIPLDIGLEKNDTRSTQFSFFIHQVNSQLSSLYKQKVLIQLHSKDKTIPPKYIIMKSNRNNLEVEESKFENTWQAYLDFDDKYNRPIDFNSAMSDNNNNNNYLTVTLLQLMNNWDIGLEVIYSSKNNGGFELRQVHHLPQDFMRKYIESYYDYRKLRKFQTINPILCDE